MFSARLLASALFSCANAGTAIVAATAPAPAAGDQAVAPAPSPLRIPRETVIIDGNPFKLSAGDFKNFFGRDTARTMGYVAIVAIASAPWDREGVNNGFNIPTSGGQSGNASGNFVFQIGAGFATSSTGKAVGNAVKKSWDCVTSLFGNC